MNHAILAVAATLIFSSLVVVPSADAAKCEAKKLNCAAKKATGLLKCHAKAEKAGTVVDPACTAKAMTKFDDPTKGCIAKAEAKGGCLVTGVTAALESTIDMFIDPNIVPTLDTFFPAVILGGSVCVSKKNKCVSKKTKGLFKCYAKAEKKALPVDLSCLQKAMDKFDGGATPAKGCFAKLETGNDCLTFADAPAIEAVVDVFIEDAVCQIIPSSCPTTTTTTSSTTTTTTVPKLVFATSINFDIGDIASLANADAECTTLANNAGILGTFMAWLSDSTASPSTRFTTQATVPYDLPDGVRVVDNWTDLVDGTIQNPIDVTENVLPIGGTLAWTATLSDGTAAADHCDDWLNAGASGLQGGTLSTDSNWTNTFVSGCNDNGRLYCFEQ